MQKLLEFIFESIGGKALSSVLAIVGLVVAWKADKWNDKRQERANARQEITVEAHELAAKGMAARDSVRSDGLSGERLRRDFCRDC